MNRRYGVGRCFPNNHVMTQNRAIVLIQSSAELHGFGCDNAWRLQFVRVPSYGSCRISDRACKLDFA